eukprot:m.22863 g.22863  ORF g.22863 m.22863 type:complete len:604 (-) comp8429_c0_seq3:122-1933(-)
MSNIRAGLCWLEQHQTLLNALAVPVQLTNSDFDVALPSQSDTATAQSREETAHRSDTPSPALPTTTATKFSNTSCTANGDDESKWTPLPLATLLYGPLGSGKASALRCVLDRCGWCSSWIDLIQHRCAVIDQLKDPVTQEVERLQQRLGQSDEEVEDTDSLPQMIVLQHLDHLRLVPHLVQLYQDLIQTAIHRKLLVIGLCELPSRLPRRLNHRKTFVQHLELQPLSHADVARLIAACTCHHTQRPSAQSAYEAQETSATCACTVSTLPSSLSSCMVTLTPHAIVSVCNQAALELALQQQQQEEGEHKSFSSLSAPRLLRTDGAQACPSLLRLTEDYTHLLEVHARKAQQHRHSLGGVSAVDIARHWKPHYGYEGIKSRLLTLARVALGSYSDSKLQRAVSPPSGAILFGPSGIGKTQIAYSTIRECGVPCFRVAADVVMSKYLGDSEENIRKIFAAAKRARPAIVLFEDLDTLAPRRGRQTSTVSGLADRLLSQLLNEMDGIETTTGLFFIACTSAQQAHLDSAILRPGRLEVKINVPFPTEDDKRAIISGFESQYNVVFEQSDVTSFLKMSRKVTAGNLVACMQQSVRRGSTRLLPVLQLV